MKDINGIIKYVNEFENNTSSNQIKIEENKNQNGFSTNSQINPEVNKNLPNQPKQRTDFSALFILMRKATKLLNLFDNKIKIVADKLSE